MQRIHQDRLGAIERHLPAGQIQLRHLLVADLAHAILIGKIRAARHLGFLVGNRFQPHKRIFQEGERRHQSDACAHINRCQHTADQAHVMERRQPDHGFVFRSNRVQIGGMAEIPHDLLEIFQQVVVTHHHAFRVTGGTGGVLQECHGVGINVGGLESSGVFIGGQIGGHAPDVETIGGIGHPGFDHG